MRTIDGFLYVVPLWWYACNYVRICRKLCWSKKNDCLVWQCFNF